MKARWKILIALGIFVVLSTAISFLTMRVQPASEVETYKKFLRDAGEKLELSEVWPPPVPAASNSASSVQDAFRLFGSAAEKLPLAMTMVAPGKAMIGWTQPDARNSDFTNSWEDFTAEVAADEPALELLHQVLARPRLDFQLDYKKGTALSLDHLMLLKRAAQKLSGASTGELHNGDAGAATTNILTLLALVQRNATEGLLISHLVRIAVAAIAVAPTWELLQTTNVTDAQLAALQKCWEQMDFLNDAKNVLITERAWNSEIIQKARVSHEEFTKTFGSGFSSSMGGGGSTPSSWETMTEKPRQAIGETMWRSSWSYSDELHALKNETIVLETLRMMQTNRSQFYKADFDAMVARLPSVGVARPGGVFFNALKIPDLSEYYGDWNLGAVVRKTIRMETADRVVVTAVALKRFQLQHGKWPGTLNELVPEFISSVPIDPNDGKPLRYHPNADGTYLLYSVGGDGKDDGGDPTNTVSGSSSFYWQHDHARDWVWPQPATEAEIKYFYEHPPK